MGQSFQVKRSAIVSYSGQQMYDVVSDIDSYSDFLPWCSEAVVEQQNADGVQAKIRYHWQGLEGSFTTQNTNEPPKRITMVLVSGPFHSLNGIWSFVALDKTSCKITLHIDFSFNNRLYAMALGSVFKKICDTMLHAFVQRAEQIYP